MSAAVPVRPATGATVSFRKSNALLGLITASATASEVFRVAAVAFNPLIPLIPEPIPNVTIEDKVSTAAEAFA